jgi:hypothetical protein
MLRGFFYAGNFRNLQCSREMAMVLQMCNKYRFMIAIITLIVLWIPYTAIGAFWDWQPFIVREDLVASKKIHNIIAPPIYAFEEYTLDNKDQSDTEKVEDSRREIRWGEFQFGSFRLRITRNHDLQLKSDTVRSNNTDGIWETMKSLPTNLGSSPYRKTMETMGKIFTPQLDLGIEF